MTYNLTGLQTSVNIVDIFIWANGITGQMLFGMFLTAIFFIIMLVLKNEGFEQAIMVSSFICFVLSGFLVFAKLLNFYFMLAFIIILALTAFYVYVVKRD